MSQNTSVKSPNRSAAKPPINPALRAALGSLDVQLEEELARYRRQRSGRPVMPARGFSRPKTQKPLELMSVERARESAQPAVTQIAAATSTTPLTGVSFSTKPDADASKKVGSEITTQTSSADALRAAVSEVDRTLVALSMPDEASEQSPREKTVDEPPIPSEYSQDARGDLVPADAAQAQPEDYLESSEKLLRSLEEQEPATKSHKGVGDRILTPLGIGSMLLLLLSSATLSYILLNPSTRSSLGFDRWLGTQPNSEEPAETANSNSETEQSIVNGPNLAADEFPEVNLDTLSRLETGSAPSPVSSPIVPIPNLPNPEAAQPAPQSALPPPVLPGGASSLPSALLAPSLPPATVSPAAPNSTPAQPKPNTSNSSSDSTQQKQSQTPKPSSNPSPTPAAVTPLGNFYYVLVNYDSDRTLEQTQAIVPDAYVENFPQGRRIQVAAFKLESEAKTLVEQLQKQGISASVYRP